MPRRSRLQSETGYLHIITRGIGRQLLFEDSADYSYYLWLLEKYSSETGVVICAYCIMQNHIHLLVLDRQNAVPLLMKKLGVSYSYYFNRNYERTGHLFQDRYKSDAIKDNSHLLGVFKYILRNPEKAGICSAEDYAWSSYRLYGKAGSFVNTEVFRDILGSYENYARFIAEELDDSIVITEGEPVRVSDKAVESVLLKTLGTVNGTVLQSFDKAKRDGAIKALREAGLSIRQIERFTGISRGIIQRIEW